MKRHPDSSLRIVCATSVAGGFEAFSTLGNTLMVPEPEINPQVVRQADMLITRSKVKITNDLLEHSNLKFYGTATAGTDHMDIDALERRGVAWSEAAGSNANSVAEYIMAVLSWLAVNRQLSWAGKTIGIIGAGHVGSRVAMLAEIMGMNVLLNDPPLRDKTGADIYRDLNDVLGRSDVVSLHVPLTDNGDQPTREMANKLFFAAMKPGAVFINASRGEVVDEYALDYASLKRVFSAIVLDVFNHEPDINIDTLQLSTLATPHIAGYSLDARLKGTDVIYRAACRHLGAQPIWQPNGKKSKLLISLSANKSQGERLIHECILSAYNPEIDDQKLRALPVGVPMKNHFQNLRKNYPDRHEFSNYTVSIPRQIAYIGESLKKLGFHISSE